MQQTHWTGSSRPSLSPALSGTAIAIGDTVAVGEVSDDDIGGWLVRHGWALDYARYSGGTYAEQQSQARSERRGMWQGEFEAPWERQRR